MKSVRKQFAGTFVTSIGLMGINFVTGVLVARLLSPSGRGEIATITTWGSILGWASALGFSDAVTYLLSRRPKDGSRIFGTASVFSLLAGTVGMLAAELLLPRAFAAQRPAVLHYAQWYMLMLPLGVLSGSLNALFAGLQDFKALNFLRILSPLINAVVLLALWACHALTVPSVLVTGAAVAGLLTVLTFWMVAKRIPLGKPSLTIMREGFVYGLKLQGALFASLGNSRLDLMLMPAILAATQIGFYSVATNLSSLIVSLLGSLGLVVFPAVARAEKKEGMLLVGKTLRMVLLGGALMALALGIAAPFLLHLVYGDRFLGAVLPLRILLPGAVLTAGALIVNNGLQAANRPAMSSYSQLAGLLVTVIGLSLTLKPFNIVGAAWTSTASYAVTFFVALLALAREPDFVIRKAVSMRAFAIDIQNYLGAENG